MFPQLSFWFVAGQLFIYSAHERAEYEQKYKLQALTLKHTALPNTGSENCGRTYLLYLASSYFSLAIYLFGQTLRDVASLFALFLSSISTFSVQNSCWLSSPWNVWIIGTSDQRVCVNRSSLSWSRKLEYRTFMADQTYKANIAKVNTTLC